MTDPLREKLIWFRTNLDLLIEDYELEKHKISVDLYFDTLEVTHIVLGVEAHRVAGRFDLGELFKPALPFGDRTLVLCLAFSGRLGPIKLLPPHQAEFLASLNKNFRVHSSLPAKQIVQQFLSEVAQTESIKKEAALLKDANGEKTLEYVREHARSAADFFKILQLTRGITWQERLIKLRREKKLRLNKHVIGYDSVVNSDMFRTLYKAFENFRQHRSAANFADAVALTILAERVREFKESKSDRRSIPRFYVCAERTGDTPTFLTILDRTKLRDAFSYTVPDHPASSSSVLRDSDYFIFKSTFQGPNDLVTRGSDTREMTRPKELRDLRNDVSSILDNSSFIRPEQLEEITFSGKTLNQVIDDLNTFLFFTNVWLPSSSKDDFALVANDLRETADELTSKSLQKRVSEGIENAKTILQENVSGYQVIRRTWLGIEGATKEIRSQGVIPDDYSRDLGLLRFAFPDSAYQRINEVLEDLLKGSGAEGESAHSNLIAACYRAHIDPNRKEDYIDDLATAASVLWVAEMYGQLDELLSGIDPLPHYSLDLIYAAALSQIREKETRSTRIVNKLYRKYRDTKDEREKANLAVGVAYLYFHFWRAEHEPVLESSDEITPVHETSDDIVKAIELAQDAYELIGKWDMKKKVYALNQYLYYMTMGGDDSLIDAMHDAAHHLLKYKGEGSVEWWQHRFDDTLARYYYRLANSTSDADQWRSYMNQALDYAQQACRRGQWDKVVRTFRDIVQNRIDKGFSHSPVLV